MAASPSCAQAGRFQRKVPISATNYCYDDRSFIDAMDCVILARSRQLLLAIYISKEPTVIMAEALESNFLKVAKYLTSSLQVLALEKGKIRSHSPSRGRFCTRISRAG
jgi:hypothetical protein